MRLEELFTPDEIENAIGGMLTRANVARDDVGEMFEFVIREERTREPLNLEPHQALLFAFVDACRYSVVRMPVGTSKTFCMAALTLHMLGRDPTQRGAVVSATQTQAAKVLAMVGSYIEDPILSAPLRLVFPDLRPSPRLNDQWTQTRIVVDRPAGIRDPSLVALGIGTAVLGSRYGWILCDDILSMENTHTPEARDKVHNFFESSILTRLDPGPHAKVVVTNTPWNQDDITYRLAGAGWPTITMSIYGDIEFENVDLDGAQFAAVRALIRPSMLKRDTWRLRGHDPDPEEKVPLWPARYSVEDIRALRESRLPHHFARSYMCRAVDDLTSRCKQQWIDRCLRAGAEVEMVSELREDERKSIDPHSFVVTGVDLAAKKGNDTAQTVLFTALIYANGDMQPLWVDAGNFTAPEIRDLVIEHHRRYNSVVFVEDNGVQQWMLDLVGEKASIPIWPFSTGMNKWDPAYGVESVFMLMSQGKWIIPNDDGKTHPAIGSWLNQCRGFHPNAHTGDILMASWFAKEGARVVQRNHEFFFEREDVGVTIYGV